MALDFKPITSRANPNIKRVSSLRIGKFRQESKQFIVEGLHEMRTALQYGHSFREVFIRQDKISEIGGTGLGNLSSASLYSLNDSTFEKISGRQNPDGYLAVVNSSLCSPISDLKPSDRPLLLLDRLEKPGNIGAILRSAMGFGFSHILVNEPNFDPHHPQIIRNSRGHSLGVRFFCGDDESLLDYFASRSIKVICSSPDSEEMLDEFSFPANSVVVLGSEHGGVSGFWKKNSDFGLKIPMKSSVDSLNVAVSASLVLFEVFKQFRSGDAINSVAKKDPT